MPYGEDFLDTLNKMLNDGGTTTSKVTQECSRCHKRIRSQLESQGLGDLIPVCAACSKAGLIDFEDSPDGGTYLVADFFGQRQQRQIKEKERQDAAQDAAWRESYQPSYMKDGIKHLGRDPNPKPSRFTKGTGKYFYDAYGNRVEEPS